jgi:hypothetical protein
MRRPLIEKGSNQHTAFQSPAKIVFNYNANSYPALIVKPGSQPNQTVNPQQAQTPSISQPQQTTVTAEETLVWEHRYFLIIERFEGYYTQFDTITKDYISLQQTVENS